MPEPPSLSRLRRVLEQPERVGVGLMSGTSADGVDAALVRLRGAGLETRFEVLAFRQFPYSAPLRRRVLRAAAEGSTRDVCELNVLVAEAFAAAALETARAAGTTVDFIGSHGQTLHHVPPARGRARAAGVPSSLQVGSGAVIAERTGAVTVSDFRPRDLAAGGQGAPLVALFDFLAFRRARGHVALQNLGGIANVTVVGSGPEDVIAFDNGPGNMVIDALAARATMGRQRMDRDGRMAAAGRVDRGLLRRLLAHPFLAVPPPKSTGREAFGQAYADALIRNRGARGARDLLATVTRFTAEAIHRSYAEFVLPDRRVLEVLVSGGGARNPVLMAHLRELFAPLPVRPVVEHGLTPENKEAVAFAVLAHETLHGHAGNLPAATGAGWPVVLGQVAW